MMTIELAPDLEERVRVEANAAGVDANSWVVEALVSRLLKPTSDPSKATRFSPEESRLLLEINKGLSESTWLRYRELVQRRDAELLTPAEYDELIALSDLIEEVHANRMECLAQLAELRGITMKELMAELSIEVRHHG